MGIYYVHLKNFGKDCLVLDVDRAVVVGPPAVAAGRGAEVGVHVAARRERDAVLVRAAAVRAGERRDGVRGVERVLGRLGVPAPRRLYDGSGLSRENLVSPATLVGLLQAVVGADEDDPVRAVLGGLPVAGFSGSLTFRFDDAPPAAVGAVRAKTGTLSGVSSLAGTVVTRDGVPMVFALMLDRVGEADEGFAQAALDSAAAACATASAKQSPTSVLSMLVSMRSAM